MGQSATVQATRTSDQPRRPSITSCLSLAASLVVAHTLACSSEPGPEATVSGDPGSNGSVTGGTTTSGNTSTSGTATSGASTGSGTTTGATSTGSGGSASTGGVSTTTPLGSTTGQVMSGDFTIDLSLSDAIPTVGIAEWASAATVDSARIDFGRESGSYEFSAPVDLAEPGYRTLLLGMKENTSYYVQIFAVSGGTTLQSEVLSLETGALLASPPDLAISDAEPESLYGGFTITCTGVGGFGGTNAGVAFIYDRDGDPVWSYDLAGSEVAQCSRARMSFDGKDMWIGNFSNVSPDGALLRLTMDGSSSQSYSLPGRHHDFAVLPNNNVLYQAQANGGMGSGGADEGEDLINELDVATGESRLLYDENTDFAQQISEDGAHTNYIEYVPHLDAISFSMRHTSTIAVISYPAPGQQAELLMTFGGPLSDFDFSWEIQHGHEVLENSILIFNNQTDGSFGTSAALEYQYDLQAGSGSQVLNYAVDGVSSSAFGDIQRLPNGNTLVTYSTAGVIHEIDARGILLREISTDPIGYAQHRQTLYGPPPTFTLGE